MKNEKLKIGIDIDEVVVEFFKDYLRLFNKRFEENISFEDLNKYHIWELTSVSREDAINLANEFHSSDEFEGISLIDKSKDSIFSLYNNFDIFFLTSRPISLKEKTESFLQKHFEDLNFEVYFTGDMHEDRKTKSEICEDLGISFMIEDHADYALDCAKKGVKTFLLDKPWNQNHEGHENLVKVKNWDEILGHLNNNK